MADQKQGAQSHRERNNKQFNSAIQKLFILAIRYQNKQMNQQKKYSCVLLLIIFCSINFVKAQQKENTLHGLNTLLVNTVMEDLFTPTVASRIYVYPNIAFYECIRQDEPSLAMISEKLNGTLFLKLFYPIILYRHAFRLLTWRKAW
jgi:hypothetical protein